MILKSDYSTGKTDVRMAQDAMDVQSACNLTAVVQTLARYTVTLMREGHGTDWVNQHPVVILFAQQISHLSFGCCPTDPECRWEWAYEFCSEVINNAAKNKSENTV